MSLLTLGVSSYSYSQTVKRVELPTTQLNFCLSSLLYDNIKINYIGIEHLKSNPRISGDFTVSLYQHLHSGFGFNIGIGIGVAPFNLNYKINPPDSSVYRLAPFGENRKTVYFKDSPYFSWFYRIPISINKISEINSNTFYSCDLGVALYKFVSKNINLQSGSVHNLLGYGPTRIFKSNQGNSNIKHMYSFFGKFGIKRILKNGHSFSIKSVLNYSPKILTTGWFEFYELTYISKGTLEQNINYIGVEFKYGFTKFHRK